MDLGKKRALEVKKVAALQLKDVSLLNPSTPRAHARAKQNQKKKNQGDGECPLKKIVSQPVASDPTSPQGTPNPPRHGMGKGLMMAHGPIINELITLQVPLLVKDKQHAVQTSHSIVKDADLDECSKHETETLRDSGLFDLMRVSYFKL